jgi:Ca-activated chloride channel family protein
MNVTLAEPRLLWLALLIPLALWLRRRRGEPALRFGPAPLLEGVPRSWRARLLPLPRLLEVGALLLAIVALARPVRREPLRREREAIDVLLCLDRSSSMAARDLDPARSRLDVAKLAAAEFLAGRPDDRIGLIGFARYPDLLCPPTRDHGALARILAAVERVEADGPEDATGLGTAVARAAQILANGEARSKVVILLTDGEENVATADHPEEIAPLHAAQLCREHGVRAYTIVAGVGAPDRAGGFVPLDVRQVERLAATTGGACFAARDADAVARVYERIAELERTALIEPRFAQTERFLPFLLTALGCLLAARLLRATWLEVLP